MAATSPVYRQDSASKATKMITVSRNSPRDAAELCAELECGNILYFSEPPFAIPAEDREALLGQKQSSAAFHKNVAYRPAEDRVTGLDKGDATGAEWLRAILRHYSQSSAKFLDELLTPYAGKWKLDYASFRPIEERGRAARLHARNDLPHVDAFPTRPTNGDRILRFFSNINPSQSRVWLTAPPFAAIAPYFAKKVGLPAAQGRGALAAGLRAVARAVHWPGSRRSPYDEFMHACHNAMKEDTEFQKTATMQRWEFPPNASWMVLTDCVSHAVLEGQYALEQTFIISRKAMVRPEMAPVAILEGLAGRALTDG
jgi:3-deoxy-D-manno-octulosonic acid hydroxylase-like protein